MTKGDFVEKENTQNKSHLHSYSPHFPRNVLRRKWPPEDSKVLFCFRFAFFYGLIYLFDAHKAFLFKETGLSTLCVFSGRIPKIFDRP